MLVTESQNSDPTLNFSPIYDAEGKCKQKMGIRHKTNYAETDCSKV